MGFLPFAPWCWGHIKNSSDDPYQMYEDIGGSDIVVLQTLCQVLQTKTHNMESPYYLLENGLQT